MNLRAVTCAFCILFPFLSSCAYYNGMYNAKHFAKQAERSERLGRTSEAADRWRVAAIHAESVIARHPRSRWADDAGLVRAKALIHLEQWSDAEVAATRAFAIAGSPEQRREAWLYIGLARAGMRANPEALTAFDSAMGSGRADVRSAAALGRGRALMVMGRPGDALADFRASREAEAEFERPRAALASGDAPLAAMFADSLAMTAPYREAQWLLLLDSLATANLMDRATNLTEQLRRRADVRAGPRARLVLGEAERQLRAGHDSIAAERFREVERIAGDSMEARVASIRLVTISLRAARTLEDAEAVRRRLITIPVPPGPAGARARDLVRLFDLLERLETAGEEADARWFLRAELLRDSLDAPGVAQAAFAGMAGRFPASPWAAKAVIAAIALGHPAADSLRALLATRYAASPYALAAAGDAGAAEPFAQLEDSLRVVLQPFLAAPAVTQPAPGQEQPERDPLDRPRPAQQPAQPQPRPGTTRPSIEP